ncbi:preprotein translocase subunit SecE [Mucilaginibacter sp. UYNi724]
MNDTFNLSRFGLLLKKTILERAMQIIGAFAAVLAFTFLLYTLILYSLDWGPAQNLTFIWGFIGGGVVLSSVVFCYFTTNAGGAAYLTLPASALEKWLCGVLISGLLFCIVFLSFFRLMDYTFVTAYHNGLDRSSPLYRNLYDHVYLYTFLDNNVVIKATILYTNFVGAMMVGSLYFNRVALVKVALVVCGLLAAIYFFNLAVVSLLFSNVDVAFPYFTVLIKVYSEVGNIELPHYAYDITNIFLQYVLPGILWITAYLRLREKEI